MAATITSNTNLLKTIWEQTLSSESAKAIKVLQQIQAFERNPAFQILALYIIGIAEGKRIERARRKKSTQALATSNLKTLFAAELYSKLSKEHQDTIINMTQELLSQPCERGKAS